MMLKKGMFNKFNVYASLKVWNTYTRRNIVHFDHMFVTTMWLISNQLILQLAVC
jgi:hypothetical protein